MALANDKTRHDDREDAGLGEENVCRSERQQGASQDENVDVLPGDPRLLESVRHAQTRD